MHFCNSLFESFMILWYRYCNRLCKLSFLPSEEFDKLFHLKFVYYSCVCVFVCVRECVYSVSYMPYMVRRQLLAVGSLLLLWVQGFELNDQAACTHRDISPTQTSWFVMSRDRVCHHLERRINYLWVYLLLVVLLEFIVGHNRDAGGGSHPVAVLSRTSMCWQSLTLVSAALFPVSFHQANVTLDSMGELALVVWFLFFSYQ